MHVRQLDTADLAPDLLQRLQREEASRSTRVIAASDLVLRDDGQLAVAGEATPVSPKGVQDLAALARIPAPYFDDIDPDLRAANFNRRLARVAGNTQVAIVWNGNDVERVSPHRTAQVSRARILEVLLEEAPRDLVPNGIRAVVYDDGEHFDVSLVSRLLQAEPRQGDIVCGGIHLTVEHDGAIQVGPATFRLFCSNGAVARVCAGGRHRIRRGPSHAGDRAAVAALRTFGRQAWGSWEQVAAGLRRLAEQPLDAGDIAHLVQRLRQSPYFISARAAQLVRDALAGTNEGTLSLYDLHNAITYVGTHLSDVLYRYRYRLRLGAGSLAQGRTRVCSACRQFVIA